MQAPNKARLIKLIHIGKSKLGMEEDTYRLMLQSIGNKSSTTQMTISELEKVLEHLKSRGFKVVPNKAGTMSKANTEQAHKIRALWLNLYEIGGIKDPSEYALSRYVKRIVGIDHLKWIDVKQGITLIETLKKWINRIERTHK